MKKEFVKLAILWQMGPMEAAMRKLFSMLLWASSMSAPMVLSACDAPADNSASSAADDKAQFLAAHANDPKALDEEYSIEATSACSVQADDYLRSVAAHDFKWDEDASGFFGVKFGSYSKASAGPGLLTLFTDKARLQNGFGAFSPFEFYCLYDVKNGKVVRFSQDDPANSVEPADDSTNNPSPISSVSDAQQGTAEPEAQPEYDQSNSGSVQNADQNVTGAADDSGPHPVSGWH